MATRFLQLTLFSTLQASLSVLLCGTREGSSAEFC
jgi:hypothetical protein